MAPENIVIPELGSVIELSDKYITNNSSVPVGRVFVDGSGVGDVGSTVLRDRKKLSTDGIIVITAVTDAYSGEMIAPIDVQTKGFVFAKNANELNSLINEKCERVFADYIRSVNMDIYSLKTKLKDGISRLIFEKTKRSPVIIVTVLAV